MLNVKIVYNPLYMPSSTHHRDRARATATPTHCCSAQPSLSLKQLLHCHISQCAVLNTRHASSKQWWILQRRVKYRLHMLFVFSAAAAAWTQLMEMVKEWLSMCGCSVQSIGVALNAKLLFVCVYFNNPCCCTIYIYAFMWHFAVNCSIVGAVGIVFGFARRFCLINVHKHKSWHVYT